MNEAPKEAAEAVAKGMKEKASFMPFVTVSLRLSFLGLVLQSDPPVFVSFWG